MLLLQHFNHPLPEPPRNSTGPCFVSVEGYWVPKGPLEELDMSNSYILTDTVRYNLKDLARVVSAA